VTVTTDDEERDLGRALRAVLETTERALDIEADAELPPGGGLGCSAALGVAIARAIGEVTGGGTTEAEVLRRAMAWERVFHGNPSGIDAAVAASGGALLFCRGEPSKPVPLRVSLHLAIGHSGLASSTKTMVDRVALRRSLEPQLVDSLFANMGRLTQEAAAALVEGDLPRLGGVLGQAQELLVALGVSSPEVDRLCSVAREAGELGAKLTGAGGGGCVVALASSEGHATAMVRAWEQAGFDGFTTRVSRRPEESA
jgi:mevalonate kinase